MTTLQIKQAAAAVSIKGNIVGALQAAWPLRFWEAVTPVGGAHNAWVETRSEEDDGQGREREGGRVLG